MTDLKGKVALVTGGSRGIGAATVRELADRGADVAISYNANQAMADAIVAEIKTHGGRAVAFRSDQSDEQAPSALVADVVEALGGLDILVANAGVFGAGPIDGDDAEPFDAMYDVNVKGTIAAIRAAAKILRNDGRIVVMSSSLSYRVGAPGLADYTASKAALEGYVKGAAHDLASRGITVNAVQAGPVNTDMNPHDGPIADWLKSQVALRRYARPEEIAAVIGFIVSSKSSYVTGAMIPVDGGGSA